MKTTAIRSAFTYFFSYAISNLFGLLAISWFVFVGVVAVVGTFTGWRMAAPRDEEATADK